MDKIKTINLECIFCHSTKFELPSDNENIECANCGKLNIHADIKKITIEKGSKIVLKDVKKEFEKSFKGSVQ